MKIGIIAGSGFDFLPPDNGWGEVSTPYGPAYLGSAQIAGKDIVVIRRHGPALNVPPHLINYHANMSALRNAGVRHVLATAAVGSLRKDLAPCSLAVIDDFIDFTKNRTTSIYGTPMETVIHTDFTVPYCAEISGAFVKAAQSLGIPVQTGVTYVCVDGPRYETPAEVRMFAQWGGDVIGMTGVPEVVLAKEMGICYGALAIITNYGSGISDKALSHADVIQGVSELSGSVLSIMESAIGLVDEAHTCKG